MKKLLIPLALASGIFSQGNNETRSLDDLLISENQTLGSFRRILESLPDNVRSSLTQARDVTILAPNNEAFARFGASQNVTTRNNETQLDPGLVAAVVQYHVLNDTLYLSNLTNTTNNNNNTNNGPRFLATHLNDEQYSNVTGGQRVECRPSSSDGDRNVTFVSGLKESARLTDRHSLNYTGGTVHVIDRVLTIPRNVTDTLIAGNLTAAAGAVQRAGLTDEVDRMRDITVFAPNNEAFAAVASVAQNMTDQQLGNILTYHVIPGQVLYSSNLTNSTVQALNGGNVTVRSDNNGSIFINGAEVNQTDILVKNGVVHVINGVLNPENPSAAPNTTATTQSPAFTGASTAPGGEVPFTSGVETPTTTAPIATGGPTEAPGEGESVASPVVSAAVAISALFGATLVALINL